MLTICSNEVEKPAGDLQLCSALARALRGVRRRPEPRRPVMFKAAGARTGVFGGRAGVDAGAAAGVEAAAGASAASRAEAASAAAVCAPARAEAVVGARTGDVRPVAAWCERTCASRLPRPPKGAAAPSEPVAAGGAVGLFVGTGSVMTFRYVTSAVA